MEYADATPELVPVYQLNEVYRERNALVAFLANLYGGVFIEDSNDLPGWGIVYIETRYGQMSWHIPPRDFDLFEDVEVVTTHEWDGHITEEKYGRLAALSRWEYMYR